MDDAARIFWTKAVALGALSINSAFYMALLRKQNQRVKEGITLTRDAFDKLDEGFYIMSVMTEVLEPTEEQADEINQKIDFYKWEKNILEKSAIATKTSPLMRSNPSPQGDIMTEMTPPAETPQVTVVEPTTEKPSRVRQFIATHPRAARAAKLTAAGLALVGVTRAVTNAQHNKDKLAEARDHALEAGEALTDAVSTPDDES